MFKGLLNIYFLLLMATLAKHIKTPWSLKKRHNQYAFSNLALVCSIAEKHCTKSCLQDPMVYDVKLRRTLMGFMLVYPRRLEGSYAILIGTFANDAKSLKLRGKELSNPFHEPQQA